jgi:hypothetical protein
MGTANADVAMARATFDEGAFEYVGPREVRQPGAVEPNRPAA